MGTRCRIQRRYAHRERGVYAIEYAFVFLLFFGLIYAIVCYSILFTFRFGLQNAAEDGARAALRYQTGASAEEALTARQAQAAQVARSRSLGWKPADANLSIETDVCQTTTGLCMQSGGTPACSASAWELRCHVRIQVTLDNLEGVFPPFPFPMPDRLVGQASAMLQGHAP